MVFCCEVMVFCWDDTVSVRDLMRAVSSSTTLSVLELLQLVEVLQQFIVVSIIYLLIHLIDALETSSPRSFICVLLFFIVLLDEIGLE